MKGSIITAVLILICLWGCEEDPVNAPAPTEVNEVIIYDHHSIMEAYVSFVDSTARMDIRFRQGDYYFLNSIIENDSINSSWYYLQGEWSLSMDGVVLPLEYKPLANSGHVDFKLFNVASDTSLLVSGRLYFKNEH